MRWIPAILLLTGPLMAQGVVEVSSQRMSGEVVGLAPLPVGGAHLPVVLLRTAKTSMLSVRGLDGKQQYHAMLSAVPLGAAAVGDAVYVAQRKGEDYSLLKLRVVGGRPVPVVEGSSDLGALRNPRLLRILDREGEPLMAFATSRNLYLTRPGKRSNILPRVRPGSMVGATRLFDGDGDGALDLYLLTDNNRIVRATRSQGGKLSLEQDYAYRTENVVARSIAGARGQLWLGGARGGKAALLLFDPAAAPSIHKFKDIFKDEQTGQRDPVGAYEIGEGSIESLEILEANELLVAGTRGGKAWIGVVQRRRGRPFVAQSVSLSGARVTAMCVNPSRAGWSLAAATDDRTLHLLRLAGDEARMPQVDLAGPAPGPAPGQPVPVGGAPAAGGVNAFFPRVEADNRRGLDTLLYMVYLGARPAQLSVRLYDDAGQLAGSRTVNLRRGQRVKVSVGEALRGQRRFDLDGYAVVAGCSERDLVVEGVIFRGTANPEAIRPFWR